MMKIKRFNESIKHSEVIDILNIIKPYINEKGVSNDRLIDVSFEDNILYIDIDIPSAFSGGKNEKISIERYLKKYGMDGSIGSYSIEIEDNENDKEILIKDIEDTIGYLQRKMKREIAPLKYSIRWKEEDIETLDYINQNPDYPFTKEDFRGIYNFRRKFKKPNIKTLKKEVNSLKKEIIKIKEEYESYIENSKLKIEKVKKQSISNIEYVKKFLDENLLDIL